MGLVKYNTSNVAGLPKGAPTIRIARKGASCISAAAVAMMGYKAGDRISFMNDDEAEEADWSIIKDTEDGFELRQNGNSGGLIFNSSGMANVILQTQSVDDETVSVTYKISRAPFDVEGENDKGWTIIMASGQ